MKRIILTVLFALSVATAIAKDESKPPVPDAARNMLETMNTQKQREIVMALVSGTQDGISWANTALNHRKQPPLYCQPDKLTITTLQMIDMIRRTIKEKPKLGDYPLGMVVLVTLQDSFPCKRNRSRGRPS
jgi:hypothetical protein